MSHRWPTMRRNQKQDNTAGTVAVDRKKFTIDKGQWIVQGDELIQTEGRVHWPCLMFGDDEWTDYDFTVELMRVHGADSGLLAVRGVDKDNYLAYGFGGARRQAPGTSRPTKAVAPDTYAGLTT